MGRIRKQLTKRGGFEKVDPEKKDKEPNPATLTPMLDENAIKEKVDRAGYVFKKFSSTLSKQQSVLLQKLIYEDSMQIDTAVETDVKMMQTLYNLFFAWTADGEVRIDDEDAVENLTEEEKWAKAEQEKEDKRKREEFERDQALIEFEEKGGFSQVLKDIFNPSDMAAMELDSVY